jgi:pimeloyl-ACP methyl ester carboxylesterase
MPDSGMAEVQGAQLAWWSDGEGEALVLVHAGVADARMWEPLLPALTASHRVVRYDLRGAGRTRSQPGAYSNADDLAALLDALAIDRAHVVGASYGGQVALEFAATHPTRVASLVLLAAALPDSDPTSAKQEFCDAEEQAIEEGRIDDAVELNVALWAGTSTPATQALVRDMQRLAFDLQLDEDAEPQDLDPPLSARLGTIDVPATIAVGDRDLADADAVAQRLAGELPQATLHRVGDAGHLLALDRPGAVAQLILRHLAT